MHCSINGRKIAYTTVGSHGLQVVMVHGWGGSQKSLMELAILLSSDYQVTVLDLPGFGESDLPGPDWGVSEYSQCVLSVIKSLGIDKPVYFGHSFGGSLGIYLAAHNPGLFYGLVLCASAYRRSGKQSGFAVRLNTLIEGYVPFFNPLVRAIKPILYRVFFRNSDLARFPHLESNYRTIILQDLSGLVDQIIVPTLILWGDMDSYTPVDMAEDLNNRITGSMKIIYPGVGHGLPRFHYHLIEPDLRRFLHDISV